MRPQIKPIPKEELLLSIIKSNAVAEAAAYPLTLMLSFWVIEPHLQLYTWYSGEWPKSSNWKEKPVPKRTAYHTHKSLPHTTLS